MKTTLTIQESAELIKRGVPNNRASDFEAASSTSPRGIGGQVIMARPIFTLADLFALLPKDIEMDFPNADGGIDTEDCYLCTQWCINGDYADNHQWCVFYTPGFQVVGDSCAKELIDALYKCLIWAIDNNHIKLD